jgi:hypothetical protein
MVMNTDDKWYVRCGPTTVGPVSMRLLLQGIKAGKIPRDSQARRADEPSWRTLMDVVVAFASALLEESELLEPLDELTDEEKTLITESPFSRAQAPAPAAPGRTPPSRPRGPRR